MKMWKDFKNKHPKTAKAFKWVGGIALIGGGICILIEKTLGENPQIGNFNSRAHFTIVR